MAVTDAQVKRMRREIDKHGNLEHAALKAGIDRKTARMYRDRGDLPSQSALGERGWRTRADPFEEVWPEMRGKLEAAPSLDAKTLFDELLERRPGEFEPGQLRTLQRKVKRWRALHGPEKEVYFSQEHRPGEAMQTDFTNCNELGVTIAGDEFLHLLCHSVLPYSNWEWATICFSESMPAMRAGVQAALQHLGGRPRFHQTDHSTAATHAIGAMASEGSTASTCACRAVTTRGGPPNPGHGRGRAPTRGRTAPPVLPVAPEVERQLAVVLDREDVHLVSCHRVQQQVITRDVLSQLRAVAQARPHLGERRSPLHRRGLPCEKVPPDVRKALQVREHGPEQLIQQLGERVACATIEEHPDLLQVPLRVLRDEDRHAASARIWRGAPPRSWSAQPERPPGHVPPRPRGRGGCARARAGGSDRAAARRSTRRRPPRCG